nr:retrovirus-related Pol polyprotein from transposon TNT 1-94 [Tanacetum cinerariifolium]
MGQCEDALGRFQINQRRSGITTLNSKFVNNMFPERGRFVIAVKLNRGLRDSNYDQLYAYLKKHQAHANENKMMMNRFTQHTVDPLALMSNVSHQHPYSQSSTTPPSTYVPPHLADNAYLDSGLSPTDNLIENLTNTLALLTQSYKTFLSQTNNQLRTSSNTRNQAIGRGAAGYGRAQNRVGNANPGQARHIKFYNCNGIGHITRNCTQPKHLQNSNYFKDKMLLMQAQENEDLAINVDNVFQADDCDAFDYDPVRRMIRTFYLSKDHVKPTVLAPGKYAIDVEPIPSRLRNNREAHLDYLRHLKESVETIREIVKEVKVVRPLDSSIVSACRYTKHSQELLEYVIGTYPQDSHQRDKKHALALLIRKKQVTFAEQCCSKHMTGDCSRLMNFMKKFIRTVRFWNNHFGAIVCYGDYVIGDSVIYRVYYTEGLGHKLFSVGQFYDSDLEVAFRKHSCYVRDTDGVELIKGSRSSNLYTISVEDIMKSSPICLLSKASKNKSWLWHRRLNHLNFAFSPKDSSQDSTTERRCRKTESYSRRGCSDNADIFQGSDVSMGRSCGYCLVFGALCYPINDRKYLGKLQPTADIGIFIGYAPAGKLNLLSWEDNPVSPVDNNPFINLFPPEPSSDASSSGD